MRKKKKKKKKEKKRKKKKEKKKKKKKKKRKKKRLRNRGCWHRDRKRVLQIGVSSVRSPEYNLAPRQNAQSDSHNNKDAEKKGGKGGEKKGKKTHVFGRISSKNKQLAIFYLSVPSRLKPLWQLTRIRGANAFSSLSFLICHSRLV